MAELLDESGSLSFSAVILRRTDVGVKANGVGEEVCWEWECGAGGVCLTGEAMELATTGVATADAGATAVAGALLAILLVG